MRDQNVAKLPHMVLQQYVDGQDTAGPSLAQLNAKLESGKEEPAGDAAATLLGRSVGAARSLAEKSKAFPVGTLLLARGGELLEDLRHCEHHCLLPRLLRLPPLRPRLSPPKRPS